MSVDGWGAVANAVLVLACVVLAAAYLRLRSRCAALDRAGGGTEDLQGLTAQAMEIHDNIVQGLTTAKLALEMNDRVTTMRALDETLIGARRIISELLAGDRRAGGLRAGDLRRGEAAGVNDL